MLRAKSGNRDERFGGTTPFSVGLRDTQWMASVRRPLVHNCVTFSCERKSST
jgi:hypothetical protein